MFAPSPPHDPPAPGFHAPNPVRDEWPGLAVVVQSTHLDMFGHANHARYLEYLEWARMEWAAFHGFPIDESVLKEQVGPAVIRVHIHYRRECRMGARLRVYAAAMSARRRIGVIHQEIRDEQTGERVCDAEVTFVMLDLKARRAVELPPLFVAAAIRRAAAQAPEPPSDTPEVTSG